MAKRVRAVLKLQLEAGKATPAPPVGPALGQHGVNIMAFCKEYNERTASQSGSIIPAEVIIYEDRSFSFALKTPPAADLIKKALGIEKGSGTPGIQAAGQISRSKLEEIARTKLPDLNATTLEQAIKIVEGTARSMGIQVV